NQTGSKNHFRIAIAGSGFGGLGMAIRLKQTGQNDFVLFERAADVGGVWRDNSYPGCACDVQSHLYSFSFAQNPSWTRAYSPQGEIHAYLKDCAHKFELLPHCRFNHEVTDAAWDDSAQLWRIQTSQGAFTADVFIAGVGALSDPSIPKLPGLEKFKGKVMHSARWDHSHELSGRKVAVIGTGASAIQFVPAIQPKVGKLSLFQRTAPWVLPRRDRAITEGQRSLFAKSRLALRMKRALIYLPRELMVLGFRNPSVIKLAHKLAVKHLERQIKDPVLRAKVTPNYTLGCKRVLISDDYLRSLDKPNVDVVTDAIREVREGSIVTSDGAEHEVETIIFGTGFHVTDMPLAKYVRGRDGRTLQEVWKGSPKAHLGITVAGCPNFFILQGPNTGLGHSSVITMLEAQFEHILAALRFLDGTNYAAVEPTAYAQERFVAEVDRKMAGTVWTAGGCASWYLDETGRNSTLWPTFVGSYRRRVASFDPNEYLSIARKSFRPSEPAAPHAASKKSKSRRATLFPQRISPRV
ncbi:MAG: flavin-containing monooxygenase, partial [Myxococcaceae bacterium]